MASVGLHPAFIWDCDDCGRENIARSILGQFDEDELEEMREEFGIQPWEAGQWYSQPETVRCAFCGSGFEVESGDDDE